MNAVQVSAYLRQSQMFWLYNDEILDIQQNYKIEEKLFHTQQRKRLAVI